MNKKTGILATLFVSTVLMLTSVHDAEARRFGGGSSFGSKPSYSQPYQHPSSPNSFAQPSRSAGQAQAAAQNQTARQGMAGRGGLMGMLGGLALGGLLGSMFFGGAFEHINFMDMLLFAGIAYLVYRLFAARSARQNQPVANAYGRNTHPETDHPAGFDTNVLFKKDGYAANANTAGIPADFDQTGFLAGAERAFRHLQTSWDNRDLAAIRGLTTDKVFAEIQDQLRASGSANKTEVLSIKAELLDVHQEGNMLEATVLFNSVMREDDSQPENVREVWRFAKPANSQQPKWFLDGIQQIAE
ncbi:MAG: Tim44-like domain-containing protein [Methylococcales bacterium]|nr:Tim44-like domain-containing protein [Methylococcales bacterium]